MQGEEHLSDGAPVAGSSGTGSNAEAPSSRQAMDPTAASGSALVPATNDASYHSMDSEELSALEELAEGESDSDTEIDRLLDDAAASFPPDTVPAMVSYLKQHGIVSFLQRYVLPDPSPLRIKHLLLALGVFLPRSIRESTVQLEALLPILKTALSRILRRREKLPQYNTLGDALDLLRTRSRIMVLSGAGISVSCGIPDFRSANGIYSTLSADPTIPPLDDPSDMFDKSYFLSHPSTFYSFAHRIFPSNFVPSSAHRFIRLIEEKGKLLRNYSQNIDTLEQVAGIERVMQCHGSFATASCTDPECGYKCKGAEIADAIFEKSVPQCPRCQERKEQDAVATKNGGAKPTKKRRKLGKTWKPAANDSSEDDSDHDNDPKNQPGFGILKPDITFFGEKLSDDFDHALLSDREHVDLLIVMGTSLKVAPVSEILGHIPHSTPVILINKTPILHLATDIMLLGDCDRIVEWICAKLSWELPEIKPNRDVVGGSAANDVEARAEQLDLQVVKEIKEEKVTLSDERHEPLEPKRMMDSHVWLFEGAEPGRLPALLAEMETDTGDDDSNAEQEVHSHTGGTA